MSLVDIGCVAIVAIMLTAGVWLVVDLGLRRRH